MQKRLLVAMLLVLLMLAGSAAAKDAKSGVLDRAYVQMVWDGWASGNVAGQAKYYAPGPGHMYFDITPLKYNSWDEYAAGVIPVLKDFSSMKFTVNDDLQIHTTGKFAWVAATVKMDGKSAKGDPVNMVLRWTGILEKVNGSWVIQHEQVSVPMAGV